MSLTLEIEEAIINLLKIKEVFFNDPLYENIVYLNLYACRCNNTDTVDGMEFLRQSGGVKDYVFTNKILSKNVEYDINHGWFVSHIDENKIYIKNKEEIRAFLYKEEINEEPKKGEELSIKTPKIKTGNQFGFITLSGLKTINHNTISRIYLSIKAEQAPWIFETLVHKLNLEKIPFSIKVIANPKGYIRHDSCVIYTEADILKNVLDLVLYQLNDSKIQLKENTPLLTKKVALGVGVADDPKDVSDGISYGQWVTKLFIDASQNSSDKMTVYKNTLNLIDKSGRDPLHPYFRKKSVHSL